MKVPALHAWWKNSLGEQGGRGVLAVFGAFLIQLTSGAFITTFGNLLPYFQSYKHATDPSADIENLIMIVSASGIVQGISFFIAGALMVPLLGNRVTLLVGSVLYSLSPVLAYLLLDASIPVLAVCYGCLSGLRIIYIPTILIPVTWFPNSKGKVVGIVSAGFGLSSTLFTPIQTFLINPDNFPALVANNSEHNTTNIIFSYPQMESRFSQTLLYMSGIYASLLAIGFFLCVEKKSTSNSSKGFAQIRECLVYLYKHGLTHYSFHLLFTTRMLSMVIIGGIIAHWKTFSLEISSDDQLLSVVGGGNGIFSAVSRILVGVLIDRFCYRYVMFGFYSLLSICLVIIYHVSSASFPGFMLLMWMVFLLSNVHFSSIPTQTIKLFEPKYNSIIQGGIGLADTLAYIVVSLLSYFIFSLGVCHNAFFCYFLSLAGCSGIAAFCSFFVPNTNKEDNKNEESNVENSERK